MDQFDIFYAKSLAYLSFRQRSEKEIREYLKKKNAPPEVAEKIILNLKKHRFINDEEFARMWIESRNRASPRSQGVLKLELQQKGISNETIEMQLTGADLAKSDLELAKAVVQKRLPRLAGLEREEIYKKLGGYLARRGFNWEVSKRSIDDLLAKEYNT